MFSKKAHFTVELGGDILYDPARVLADMDDGSVDGNQRLIIGTQSTPGSSDDTDGIADGLPEQEIAIFTQTPFPKEDVDLDTYQGDDDTGIPAEGSTPAGGASLAQRVDMSDFRRFRDWLLMSANIGENLNGEGDNLKKAQEEGSLVYIWGDLNGDGSMSLNDRVPVFDLERLAEFGQAYTALEGFEISGAISVQSVAVERYEDDNNGVDAPLLNDFEVFYNTIKHDNLWRDENYQLTEIPDLLNSGDIEVWPHFLFNNYPPKTPTIGCIKSEVIGEGQNRTHKRDLTRDPHTIDYERQIYTLLVGTYNLRVTAFGAEDCTGETVFIIQKDFEVKLGSDELWDPLPNPAFSVKVGGQVLVEANEILINNVEVTKVIEPTCPSPYPLELKCDENGNGEDSEDPIYKYEDSLKCVPFEVTAHHLGSEEAWTLSNPDSKFSATLDKESVYEDPIEPSTQIIKVKRLLPAGNYNLTSIIDANLNPDLGLDSDITGQFTAPETTVTVKIEELAETPDCGSGGGGNGGGSGDPGFVDPRRWPNPGNFNGGSRPSYSASVSGDPHLITIDGGFYSFQAAGDYILTRSTEIANDFEIQIRFIPVQTEGHEWSGIHAIAAMVQGDKIEIYKQGSSVRVYVNETLQNYTVDEPILMDSGGIFTVGSDTIRTDWGNGSLFIIKNESASDFVDLFSSIEVILPEEVHQDKIEGLLGSYDSDPTNDIQIRDGSILTDPAERELYTSGFRDSWSIYHGASTSLFNQENDPYDANYPGSEIELANFSSEEILAAQIACIEAGITAPNALRACILDVLITGNLNWISPSVGIDPYSPGLLTFPVILRTFIGESVDISALISNIEESDLQWQASAGNLVVDSDTSLLVNYTAPNTAGEYLVEVSSISDPDLSATTKVIVTENFAVTESRQLASAGNFRHSMVLKDDGTVWAWGSNSYGQLGNGTTSWSYVPTQVIDSLNNPLQNILEIAAGSQMSYALQADGTVWAWGGNASGKLGNGGTTNSSYPVKVLSSGSELNLVTRIAAGDLHGLALREDGSVWAWGENSCGRLGDGTTTDRSQAVQVLYSSGNPFIAISIAAGDRRSLALQANGSVWEWGCIGSGQTLHPVQVLDTSGNPLGAIASIAARGLQNVALQVMGESPDQSTAVWGWRSSETSATEVQDNQGQTLDDVIGIAADNTSTTVLRSGGSAWLYTTPVLEPIQDTSGNNLNNIVAVADQLVLKDDSSVWPKGSAFGEVEAGIYGYREGNYNTSDLYLQVLSPQSSSPFNNVDSVAVTEPASYAIQNGNIWLWGSLEEYNRGISFPYPNLASDVLDYSASNGNASSLVAGHYYEGFDYQTVVVLQSDGTVWAWPYQGLIKDSLGQPIQNIVSIKLTAGTSALNTALDTNGSVWYWLGMNEKNENPTAEQLVDASGVPIENITKVVIAGEVYYVNKHGLVRSSNGNGSLWAWGSNDYGQLGDGTTEDKNYAVKVIKASGEELTNVIDIAVGERHSLALVNDDTVWAWGNNSYGQLGDGTTVSKTHATQVVTASGSALTNITKVFAGFSRNFALKSDGSLWAWGRNSYGELGDNTTNNSLHATEVVTASGTPLTGIVDVTIEDQYTIALHGDNTVWAWGDNSGRLGNGTTEARSYAVEVRASSGQPLTGIAGVTSTYFQSIATANDDTIWTWGSNSGNGTSANSPYAVQVNQYSFMPFSLE